LQIEQKKGKVFSPEDSLLEKGRKEKLNPLLELWLFYCEEFTREIKPIGRT